jgi:hypothetical protein
MICQAAHELLSASSRLGLNPTRTAQTPVLWGARPLTALINDQNWLL